MPAELLSCVEVEPAATRGEVRASVVWLHGLGADGHDFEPIVPELRLSLPVRFVFPHAPVIPVTINGGMRMRAWYDIRTLDPERFEERADATGVRRSAAQVEALIAREAERGVPAARVVLAGFSQGGAIALYHGLRRAEPLAGIAALSAYLVSSDALETEASAASRAVPVFQAHGTHDPLVPFAAGEAARARLSALGHAVEWSAWPMGHEVCMEEIRALGAWLERVLAAGPPA